MQWRGRAGQGSEHVREQGCVYINPQQATILVQQGAGEEAEDHHVRQSAGRGRRYQEAF